MALTTATTTRFDISVGVARMYRKPSRIWPFALGTRWAGLISSVRMARSATMTATNETALSAKHQPVRTKL